jgi:hypothetical protein
MLRLTAYGLVLCAMFNSADAEVLLTDNSELLGSWKLESVSPGYKKVKIEENRIWEFRADGTIVTSGYNRILHSDDRYEWKYQIVDGRIVAEDPGRPGKTMNYTVYEKTRDSMVLQGGIEGFYFFKKN